MLTLTVLVAAGATAVVVARAVVWAHNRPRLLAQYMRRPE
jgi:hypothetical protein